MKRERAMQRGPHLDSAEKLRRDLPRLDYLSLDVSSFILAALSAHTDGNTRKDSVSYESEGPKQKREGKKRKNDEHVSIFENRRIDSVRSMESDDLAPDLVRQKRRGKSG